MNREVTIKAENDTIGSWRIECPTCPLRKHTDAVGLKPKTCASGIQNSHARAVLSSQCEHYHNESLGAENKGKTLTIKCRKEDEQ